MRVRIEGAWYESREVNLKVKEPKKAPPKK